ncbi:hypothetical protein [Pleurocapsa sp. FMAR1]|uniref:hypothetical protein n=1 Tax=Pleurocapsa sp. FMAR1 TaxID=3040204 RepID=UPI0029C6B799|nr:hypothetical protein [Pleurocapsa sp. FMAR1]
MKTIETIKRTGVIFSAAGMIILVALPLAKTNWAEAIRTGFAEHHQPELKTNDTGSFKAIAPSLLKATMLIGVPGAIAIFARKVKRKSR